MRITDKRIWCVRDPGPEAELGDFLFETTLGQLPEYVVGTGVRRFRLERHEFYDSYEDAVQDASGRMLDRARRRQADPLAGD